MFRKKAAQEEQQWRNAQARLSGGEVLEISRE